MPVNTAYTAILRELNYVQTHLAYQNSRIVFMKVINISINVNPPFTHCKDSSRIEKKKTEL